MIGWQWGPSALRLLHPVAGIKRSDGGPVV